MSNGVRDRTGSDGVDLSYVLDDRYTRDRGRVYLDGGQALVRVLLMQRQRHVAAGLNTAGYVSGYRGSPLGVLDMALWKAAPHLERHHVHFKPGVNEELAATAVWGTQQLSLMVGSRYDGVFGLWYGKGPGVDRAGDALKTANHAGTNKLGKDDETAPIGAGPYKFQDWKPQLLLSLRSWPGYWDRDELKLGGIDFIQTAPGAPSVAALSAGTIDMVDLNSSDAASIDGRPGLAVSRALGDSDLMMPVCQTKAPFDKPEARQALEYALNRSDIKKAVYGDQSGAVADSPLPSASALYTKPTPDVDYQFDTAKAKQLLPQAGVAPGTTVEMITAGNNVTPAAEVIQAQLAAVGLKLNITPTTNILADLAAKVPNVVLLENKLSAVSFWVTPGGGPNYCKYSNPTLTAAINSASSANPDTQKKGWADAQAIYRSDIPIVFIASVPVQNGHTDKVQGATIMHSQAAGPLWRTIYIKK